MPNVVLPANGWRPRPYQLRAWSYMEHGGKRAVCVWHRRSGKDEVALHRIACAVHERPANYWHMLPEAAQARKAIWDAVNPRTGRRRIDEAFPHELRSTTREHEMFIGFKCGGSYQVLGSDNYDSLVGSTPAGVVYSEWPLSRPQADAYLMPILAENNGWELYIYTPRGRNHGLTTLQAARKDQKAFAEVLTVDDTGIISQDILDRQREAYIAKFGEEHGLSFYNQEYLCSFDAANIGAILGRELERAEREGRINSDVSIDHDGAPIEVSSDIGFRDTATWWFWQPKVGGFSIVDYMGASGLDADDWIEKIRAKGYNIGTIHLPHDARVKTFQSKHSSVERFLLAFGADRVRIVPRVSVSDRINAARKIIQRCEFHADNCEKGMAGLREWSYEWNEDTQDFSREPVHNWASHPGDGFSYGAQVMMERAVIAPPKVVPIRGISVGRPSTVTFDELWAEAEANRPSGRI